MNENIEEELIDNYELNNLEFDKALELDKRSFIATYWSKLRREHLILFTFFVRNDYNLTFVKYSRFIFIICTDMAEMFSFFKIILCIQFMLIMENIILYNKYLK